MSADGRFVVFWSGANLLPGLDAYGNIFRRNLATGQLRLVSANAAGDPANRTSYDADVSADGRYVVFRSAATNLTPVEHTGSPSIFLKDMVTGDIDWSPVGGRCRRQRRLLEPDDFTRTRHADRLRSPTPPT